MSDQAISASEVNAPHTASASDPLDELLQRSRRMDWRFLLPDPRLGRVVYFGPADDPLRAALADFADAVTDADALAPNPPEPFDVAVLRTQPPERLAQARTLLKPGGVLYVEIQRRAGRDIPWQLRRYAAAAERAGFGEIETFWNWPNFTRCTRILPVDDACALTNAVVNNRRGPLAWVMLNAARFGFHLGVVGWAAPCLSLIARRETS